MAVTVFCCCYDKLNVRKRQCPKNYLIGGQLRANRKKYSQECSSQLIEVCSAHKNVDAEQAPIFRYDHQGISRPYHAGGGQRGALRDAQFFCRTCNVADASDHQALNSTVYLKHNGQRTRVAICRLFTHLNAGAQKKIVLGPVKTKTTRVNGCTCIHCVDRCLVRARLRYACEREFDEVRVVRTAVGRTSIVAVGGNAVWHERHARQYGSPAFEHSSRHDGVRARSPAIAPFVRSRRVNGPRDT